MSALTKRHRWLRRRALRGLHRPLPLRVVVANGQSASGVTPLHTNGIIERAAEHADLLLLCEVFNVRVATTLESSGWRVTQVGRRGSSQASLAIAVREDRGQWADPANTTRPIGPTLSGRRAPNLRARNWLTRRITFDPGTTHRWTRKTSTGHAPPKRGAFLWAAYWATRPTGVLGLDANEPRTSLLRRVTRRVLQAGLLALIVPRWIHTSTPKPLDVGGDHLAVAVTLWPNKE